MRWRLWIGLAVAAGSLSCALAAPALAGTYTWQLPTASNPGSSNPGRDAYGATPWTYVEASLLASPMTSIQSLPTYSTSIDSATAPPGLTGWWDTGDADEPFVAANRTSGTLGSGGFQIEPGQLALQPAHDQMVGIGWTSPLDSAQMVAIDGTFTPDDTTDAQCVSSQPSWEIVQNGQVIAGPSNSPQLSQTTSVNPGDTVYLFVLRGAPYFAACDTAGVTLSIEAPSSPPSVSLSSPSAGETISQAQPSFSGRDSSGFGDSRYVSVRVWNGSSVTGSPLETLSTSGSGGSYSVAPSPSLPNGTYTAQAEQDDLAGDTAHSDPVTFTVHNIAPTVTISPLGRGPLTTPTPLMRGTSGTGPGDSTTIGVGIWPGSTVAGHPMLYLTTTRAADGSWSVRVTPGLAGGRYTAVAVQEGPGDIYGVSRAQTFVIKSHPVSVIAGPPTLDSSNHAVIPIACPARSGTCTGDVLVVTARDMRPLPDGPSGHVRVMFGYVSVAAGRIVFVRRPVARYLASVLRHAAPVAVRVTVDLTDSAGRPIAASAIWRLRL